MKTIQEVMKLDIEAFFRYVDTIGYGYRDQSGRLHFSQEEDFTVRDYAFSSPEDVVENNCGWCWDVAELTRRYCAEHGIPCRSWFMEYFSDELHQTHTQVFLQFNGKWCPAPENSLGLRLGERGFAALEQSVQCFTDWFVEYLKSVLKEKYNAAHLLVKEYTRTFARGITDESYLEQIREG